MKIGLLGHGTIGVGVDRIIASVPGLEVSKILSLVLDEEMKGRAAASPDDILLDPEIDTVVEVMGGVELAFSFLKKAMEQGKNVVTANKAVVAAHYEELAFLAKKQGVSFRATASVGGSIPWLVNLERSLRVGKILSIEGIMNGTTNYILNAMTRENLSFETALRAASEAGYAEKDPSADIDGLDVRRKLLISANVAFSTVLREEEIPTFGIRHIDRSDIEFAASRDRTIKLTAFAKRNADGSVQAFVIPRFVRNDRVESCIGANYNMITYEGSFSGRQTFIGEGAGRFPTAYNVVEDLLDIRDSHPGFYQTVFTPAVPDNAPALLKFYLRVGSKRTLSEQPVSFAEAAAQASELLNAGEKTFLAAYDE
ncbi:MAG: homoserine dehydrogenase [Lachnospiraceae bacterium]|nr:homoserine dehydrogenase [Lachnospiraceae bacterium]